MNLKEYISFNMSLKQYYYHNIIKQVENKFILDLTVYS